MENDTTPRDEYVWGVTVICATLVFVIFVLYARIKYLENEVEKLEQTIRIIDSNDS